MKEQVSFKVRKKDLVGEISKLTIPIVALMLKRQHEQNGVVDVSVFQESNYASKGEGGFDWSKTPEGHLFWDEVAGNSNIELFKLTYPTKKKLINLVKILNKAPIGTKLYSTIIGYCTISNIEEHKTTNYVIIVEKKPNNSFFDNAYFSFDKYGRYIACEKDSECVLFPSKTQRDWSVFNKELNANLKKSKK